MHSRFHLFRRNDPPAFAGAEMFSLYSVPTVTSPTAKTDLGGADRGGQGANARRLWRRQGLACLMLALALLVPALATPAFGQSAAVPAEPSAILSEAGPGTRWGLVVVDDTGRELVAIDPDDRFIPATNTTLVIYNAFDNHDRI